VVAPYLPAYVAAALRHLHALYPTFVRYYLTDSVPVPNSSEGEPIELYKLITGLVDFVSDATRQSKSRVSFDEGTLGKLVNALVQWTQMTKENVSWLVLLRGSLTTCASRRKNGPQTRICSYLKRRMILSCTACGSLYSIYSRCVLIENDSHPRLTYHCHCSSPFCPTPLFRQYLLYTLRSNVSLLRPIRLEKLGWMTGK
jgi:hypothetical protein